MRRRFRYALMTMSVILCLATAVFGQRTTGDIEGKVTDTNGAVVPGISITVTGITVGFSRTVQSDGQGEFRVQQVPIGSYNVTTSATSGFAAATVNDVTVTIEKATVVNIKLGLSTTAESVVVTSDALAVNVDITDSKVQTNITQKLIDQLPNGTSFTSLLKISPATRQESRSGGFQVDGASGSENAFIIDGLSLENFRTGTLNGVNNIPTALVSEIQIKTGGFEAEHGGASGGVISVVTKSGSDSFHGEFGSAFELSGLQPKPRFTLQRFVSSSLTQAAILANPDYVYTLPQNKDKFANFYPTATLGGPAINGGVWYLGSYSPQVFRTTRVSNFINSLNNSDFSTGRFVPSPRLVSGTTTLQPALTYKRKIKSEYAFGRLDAAILNNLRGSVTYLWNPEITDGNLPFDSITTSIPVNVPYAGFSYPSDQYARLQGGRVNSNNITSQLAWTPTGKLVATFRYGRAFQNQKGDNYGLSAVIRNRCQGSASANNTIATGCPRQFANVPTNSITIRDASIRNEFNGDVSYILNNFGGSHEFKGGYQYGRTSNDVFNG